MDAHGVAGAGLVPLEQEVQNHEIVAEGDVLHVLAVLGNLHDFVYGSVDDGIEAAHILVVRGPDDGPVKFLVRQGPVSPLSGGLLHPAGLVQNLLQLLVAGPLAGQGHGGGLKNQPHFKKVLGPDPGADARQGGEVHPRVGQVLRHKGALSPADVQHPLGHQEGDGLPQGGAADGQGLAELVFIGQLAAGGIALFLHNPFIQAVGGLLRQFRTSVLHHDAPPSSGGAGPPPAEPPGQTSPTVTAQAAKQPCGGLHNRHRGRRAAALPLFDNRYVPVINCADDIIYPS